MIVWNRYPKTTPPLHQSVLVRTEMLGPIYDVAVFAGVQPNGDRRWIMADVQLDYREITHWAEVDEPEDVEA